MGSGAHTSDASGGSAKVGDRQTVVDAMLSIEHVIANAAPADALQLVGFCRRRLDAAEAGIVADRYEAGASDSQVEDMFTRDGKTSKAKARKTASRGKAVHANPTIATKLADGDLSTEQADVLADAADESDGAAACDEELIEAVSKSTPEQGRRKAKRWVTKRKSADDVQKAHDRQHRNRCVYRNRTGDGREQLIIEGPGHELDRMERRIGEGADREYRADGGRDVPRHKHPRTRDQRRYDAAKKLMLGDDDEESSQESGQGETVESVWANGSSGSAGTDTATTSDPSAAANKAKTQKTKPAGRRSTMFVTLTLDQLLGVDRSTVTACDGTRLPPSVVEQLACESEFVGVVFDQAGEVLWQGRKHRHATPAQVRALIVRDGGCVECGAHHDLCVAHHVLPWEAPRRGESNIDSLVFLCERCHVRLHQRNLTLVRNIETREWETRPATVDELPPSGGSPPRRRPGERAHGHRQRDRTVKAKPRLDELRRTLHQGQPSNNLTPPTTDRPAASEGNGAAS